MYTRLRTVRTCGCALNKKKKTFEETYKYRVLERKILIHRHTEMLLLRQVTGRKKNGKVTRNALGVVA